MNDTEVETKFSKDLNLKNQLVKVTEAGNIAKLQLLKSTNTAANVIKIDRDRYYISSELDKVQLNKISEYRKKIRTDMPIFSDLVHLYKHNSDRLQDIKGLKRSFNKLKLLINANFVGNPNELWITLTFKNGINDLKQANKMFDKFNKRLHKIYNNLVYIVVPEPHGNGNWHFHLLLKNKSVRKWYLPTSELSHIWSYGFVKVKRLNQSDNVGAYLTSYLTDMPLNEYTKNIGDINEDDKKSIRVKTVANGKKKAILKGHRLMFYKSGVRYYRCSQNVKRPIIYHESVKKLRSKYNKETLTSSYISEIYSNDYNKETEETERTLINVVVAEWHNINKNKRLHKKYNIV